MSEQERGKRARVSLRGRGREILTGQPRDDVPSGEIDAQSLQLTPHEADSLLALDAVPPNAPALADYADLDVAAVPPESESPDEMHAAEDDCSEQDSAAANLLSEVIEVDAPPEPLEDLYDVGEPLPEDLAALLGALEDADSLDEPPPEPDTEDSRPYVLPEFDRVECDTAAWDDAEDPAPRAHSLPSPEISGPPPGERLPVAHSFGELAAVVNDDTLRRLVAQIEALQEDLAGALEFEPDAVEAWQRQLFEAHLYLMRSRVNYEAARMAVIGIQTEMSRQRRVRADVMRYRPLLLNYLVGWGIAWIVLMALKGMVVGVADTIGLTLVAAAYYPALFGILGALVGSYLALERHAVRQRDFDPLYITGYLANPLLGGAAGLLTFLAFGLANHNMLDGSATDLERIVLWIAAAVVGLNQSAILQRVAVLFSRSASDPDQST